jgi:hypothetical protein
MATGLTFRTALRDSAIKFELEKFTYLGQIASEGNSSTSEARHRLRASKRSRKPTRRARSPSSERRRRSTTPMLFPWPWRRS